MKTRSHPHVNVRSWTGALLSLLAVPCLVAQAGAPPLPPSLLACTRVTDEGERLRCFDREMQSLSHAAEAAPHPSPPSPAPHAAAGEAPPPPVPAEAFGRASTPRPPEVKRLDAHITSISQGGARPRFVLDNGQVWQQAEIDNLFQAKVGDPVTLTKGMLGSFFMSAGTHAAVRVTRVN